MSQSKARSDGKIAATLLAIISVIFVAHPYFLPAQSEQFWLGLPAWYWLEFGIMALLYVLYWAFTTRVDALYEMMGVAE